MMDWKWNNQKGMTLVELIVSFSILMIALAMFSTCLNTSSRVRLRIHATKERLQEFCRSYYLEEFQALEPEETVEIILKFEKRDGDGHFTVPAALRTFRAETGVFYDVVPERSTGHEEQ